MSAPAEEPDPKLSETGRRRWFRARRLRSLEPRRPRWQRVTLPVLGAGLVLAGLALWLLPIVPGGVLALLGLPLLFAWSGRHELDFRRRSRRAWRRAQGWVRRRLER